MKELLSTFGLSGKVALVTGAARGLGAQAAEALAHAGACVVISDILPEVAQETAARIREQGGQALALNHDVTRESDWQAVVAEVVESCGGLDVLVNNAGIAPFESIEDMNEGSYDRLSNVNMRSVFFVTRYLLPKMRSGGRIVNLSSIVARTAFDGIPAYSATKGFVDVLTLQLAASLGPRGITVNAVAPGVIETRLTTGLLEGGGADAVQSMQALAGIGTPDRVAGVVSFLAGPDAGWTTGQVIDVSGGTKL